jgi:hypothetical protein
MASSISEIPGDSCYPNMSCSRRVRVRVRVPVLTLAGAWYSTALLSLSPALGSEFSSIAVVP